MAARCCWMKSARCLRPRKPSCCACWKIAKCAGWEARAETPVDVRVLAATNKDPEQAVADGQLRQDLYFRLNVFHIHLPPLREHKEDMPMLVEQSLRDINAKHGSQVRGIGAEVLDIFMGHTWPGNIRELRNVLERATIVCDEDLIRVRTCRREFGTPPQRAERTSGDRVSGGHHRGCHGTRTDPADTGRHRE